MKLILAILLLLYAGATLTAVFVNGRQVLAKHTLTIGGAASLLLGLWWPIFVPLGLLALLVAAVMNGLRMYGEIHFSHLAVRLGYSLVVMLLWWYVWG
ncbi:hypothetical protein [Lacticaseibacillus suibinensis]|uniref:hypothetical protein n=1 Tax=Lacticaseibacillus suibinensis TaxID=2486011 RepID=UPI000F779A35|nr:hypothetical protein [Lacticaseibacillus suibinensis]